ncbi:TetR/AcrR family transcriptional regulator [Thalassotalea sp. Y01]|uniref:TetR/AcrR family transcriptional regulator n=1 Tax=Thalassotalea sp. Y01 TaxID=2729613 RepID=UPI00145DDCDC|nr:TetR/AcrR family transcriptional regulator [Thalassotalea sp. Y01]NMP14727.1 TetR/AcrR family transcriptional regulator [Thalassotalea sp. Y01]
MTTNAKKKRIRQKPEERLAEILDISHKMFVEKGYEATSMADVAKQIGIVEGTIYRYFKTKKDVLISVLERWYNDALADYTHNLAGITGVKNRLHFMIWHHLNVLKAEPALCDMIVQHVRVGIDYEATKIFELNKAYSSNVDKIIKEGIQNNTFRSDAPITLIRDMIYGGVEYHAWRYVTGRSNRLDVDSIADQISDVVYRALLNTDNKGSGQPRQNDNSAILAKLEQLEQKLDKLS